MQRAVFDPEAKEASTESSGGDSELSRRCAPAKDFAPGELLASISATLVDSAGLGETVFQRVFERIAAQFDFEVFFHFQVEDGQDRLRLIAVRGLGDAERAQLATVGFDQLLLGPAAEARFLVIHNFSDAPERARAVAYSPSLRTCVELRLSVRLRVLGTVSFASHASRELGVADLQLLRTACDIVAIHLAGVQSERRLRDRDRQLRLAMEAASATAFQWDIQNDSVTRFQPLATPLPETSFGAGGLADYRQLIHEEDRRHFDTKLREAISNPTGVYEVEYRLLKPDGIFCWVCDRGQVDFDGEGRPLRLVGICLDGTARRLAREALEESEERLRLALEASHTGIWEWNLQSDAVKWSPEAYAIHGIAVGRFGGSAAAFRELVHPDDTDLVWRSVRAAITSRSLYALEFRIVRPDGAVRWVTNRGRVGLDMNGQLKWMRGTITDITERRTAEEHLRLQSEMLTHMNKGVVLTRVADGTIVHSNPKFNEMFSYDAGELVGRHISVVNGTGERSAEQVAEEIIRELKSAGVWSGELLNRRKDGLLFWCRATVSTFKHSDFGEVWISVHTDITREIEARAALSASEQRARAVLELSRESRELFQTVIDNAPSGILVVNTAGEFLLANKAAENLLGGKPTGAADGPSHRYSLQTSDGAVFPAQDLPLVRALRGEEACEAELMIRRGDGSEVTVLAAGKPVRRANGELWAAVAIMKDITSRKANEQALKRAEAALREHAEQLESKISERTRELKDSNARLEAQARERLAMEEHRAALLRKLANAEEDGRRRIARELHDEMGQYITALILGLKSLRNAAEPYAGLADLVRNLEKMAAQIGMEVHRVALQLRPTALDDLGLLATVRNYVQSWGKRVQVLVDFQSTTYPAAGLSAEIETTFYRTVQESLNNVARHARASRVSVILECTQRYAQLIVEDNGIGFDTDLALHSGVAAGKLGLLGMRERLANLGGSLQVESTPGSGATLFARIPLIGADEFDAKNPNFARG